jgi:hypothetical protein
LRVVDLDELCVMIGVSPSYSDKRPRQGQEPTVDHVGSCRSAEGVGAKRPTPERWGEMTRRQRRHWKSSDQGSDAAGGEMSDADGSVARGNVGDTGRGMNGGTIGDIPSSKTGSKTGSTGNGGTGGTSRNIMGESKSSCGGDRGSSGDGTGCYHQTHAEAVGDKRPTPQVLDPWSKPQTKEALGEEDDAGGGAGTDEDSSEASGTTKSQKVDKGRGAGSAMSGGAGKGAGSRSSEAASGAGSGAGSGADKGAGSGSNSGVDTGADSTAEGVGAKRPMPDNWGEMTRTQRKNWRARHWR